MAAAAPGHVDAVRDLVLDALDPDRIDALREANERILRRVDPDQATRPAWSVDHPSHRMTAR